MDKGITVKELAVLCYQQIEKGNGEKHIIISNDDEGNGFHTLFYGFTDDKDSINYYHQEGMFHDDNNPKEIVILG